MDERDIAKKVYYKNRMEACPRCKKVLGQYTMGRRELYCINCGQKIKRRWGDDNGSDEQQIEVN